MPLSPNIKDYEDCLRIFEKAHSQTNAFQLTFPTPGKAAHFRQRCYKYRTLERTRNMTMYAMGDELYGQSAFDDVTFEVEGCHVIVRRQPTFVVTELPDD